MSSSILLARQAIFDRNLKTVAYELLYRSPDGQGPTLPFNGSIATAKVLQHAYSCIFDQGKVKTLPAFINFNAEWLYNGDLPSLKPEALVLEILEDIPMTPELVDRLQFLSDAGYRLALDDFLYDQSWDKALKIVQFVKIDIQQLSPAQLVRHVSELKKHNVTLLAEKVETYQQYNYCRSLGFKLFQGYFFCRPEPVRGVDHAASSVTMLSLIAELEDPDVTPEALEAIILREPQLVIRLLKIVNSARYALSREVSNISEAIIAIGLNELKKWVMLLTVSDCNVKTTELIREILARAKMCELMAEKYSLPPNTAFMIGLLSGMDALLNISMSEITTQLALAHEVRVALNTQEGELGKLLHDVKYFMCGSWDDLYHKQDSGGIALAYSQSLQWVMDTMQELESI